MTGTRTTLRMADHAVAAIHGGAWKPSLRQLAERAVDDADTFTALSAQGAPPISDDAFRALEDAAWESRRALQAWLQDAGLPIALIAKMGAVL